MKDGSWGWEVYKCICTVPFVRLVSIVISNGYHWDWTLPLLPFPVPDFPPFPSSRPTQRQATPLRMTSARLARRVAALAGGPAFARCCRRRRRPRLLSQDGGTSGRVLQRWEPGVVPDVPGAAAAGRGGSLRLPVQNAGSKMSLFQWKTQPCRHLAYKLTVCFRSGNN